MQSVIVNQGIDLMLYGMGTVFVFLVLLIIVTGLMSSLVNRFAPDLPEPEAAPVALAQPGRAQQVDPRIAKVIEAAIKQHRAR